MVRELFRITPTGTDTEGINRLPYTPMSGDISCFQSQALFPPSPLWALMLFVPLHLYVTLGSCPSTATPSPVAPTPTEFPGALCPTSGLPSPHTVALPSQSFLLPSITFTHLGETWAVNTACQYFGTPHPLLLFPTNKPLATAELPFSLKGFAFSHCFATPVLITLYLLLFATLLLRYASVSSLNTVPSSGHLTTARSP